MDQDQGSEELTALTGSFIIAQRDGRWFWKTRVGNMGLNGGPYFTQAAAQLGLLYQLSLVFTEQFQVDGKAANANSKPYSGNKH